MDISKRKWRRKYRSQKVPIVKWEALKNEQVCKRFEQEVERRLRQEAQKTGREDSTRWSGGRGAEQSGVVWCRQLDCWI